MKIKLLSAEKADIRHHAQRIVRLARALQAIEEIFTEGRKDEAARTLRKLVRDVRDTANTYRYILMMQGPIGDYILNEWNPEDK